MIVKIRDLVLGQGRPKICVSITGRTQEEILQKAMIIKQKQVDMVEWRADFFEQLRELEKVKEIAQQLRNLFDNTPILFTIRSKLEGGEQELLSEEYQNINLEIAKSGFVDCIDIELFTKGINIKEVIKELHKENIIVFASNHDFEKTPKKEEIIRRLVSMKELGADISKIALMPQNANDVLTVLEATNEMKEYYTSIPIITMSMGQLGIITRMAGSIFGSILTFASIGEASAPGQIPIDELKKILLLFPE